jgi:hypothetical protein
MEDKYMLIYQYNDNIDIEFETAIATFKSLEDIKKHIEKRNMMNDTIYCISGIYKIEKVYNVVEKVVKTLEIVEDRYLDNNN